MSSCIFLRAYAIAYYALPRFPIALALPAESWIWSWLCRLHTLTYHDSLPPQRKCVPLAQYSVEHKVGLGTEHPHRRTMAFRRAYGNYVNLGSLYSVPPWGTVPPFGLSRPQHNSVNLGSLYARSKSKFPTGWAYFEDGSVFILPFAWLPHDAFEARMRIAAQFVSGPTPRMQEIRRESPHRKRFIIIK